MGKNLPRLESRDGDVDQPISDERELLDEGCERELLLEDVELAYAWESGDGASSSVRLAPIPIAISVHSRHRGSESQVNVERTIACRWDDEVDATAERDLVAVACVVHTLFDFIRRAVDPQVYVVSNLPALTGDASTCCIDPIPEAELDVDVSNSLARGIEDLSITNTCTITHASKVESHTTREDVRRDLHLAVMRLGTNENAELELTQDNGIALMSYLYATSLVVVLVVSGISSSRH
jgi:hypothetical protein